MNIFLAGATGAIGRRLIPMLVARGHRVTGTTRSIERSGSIRDAGAEPLILDALDGSAVMRAVTAARPDAVVHQMTAINENFNPRKFDAEFAATNLLRTRGTDHLLAAARAVGARRFVAQSYAGWPSAGAAGRLSTEEDGLTGTPPATMRQSLNAIRHLETVVTAAPNLGGVVLRYGSFYGPGTSIAEAGSIATAVRRRMLPIMGEGTGVWSFIHIDDAASATVAAIEATATGLFNVADDDPAEVRVWLPELANALDAPAPRRVPVWLARLFAGDAGVMMMTSARGVSNKKVKSELGWQPGYRSWRQGFRTGLSVARTEAEGLRSPKRVSEVSRR